ncbi:hypothetical protein BJ085DRAFT_7119, partial [Dimargaris cristalligena]
TKTAVNLSVLQRHDRSIVRLLDQSSHVVIYYFDLHANQGQGGWAKKGVEGTLFLFQRNTPPYYGFVVMNRLALDNFFVFLQPTMEVQSTSEYIIFR